MKRFGFVAGLLVILAAIAASAALAWPPGSLYCVNNHTTTLPTSVSFDGGSAALSQSNADFIIGWPFGKGLFFAGFITGTTRAVLFVPDFTGQMPDAFLAPGFSANFVYHGACNGSAVNVQTPGSSFMCASGYGEHSNPDYVAGKTNIAAYLKGDPGRHYAYFVLGDLNGPQLAQSIKGAPPLGSFYCKIPTNLKVQPITGPDGKQKLADTLGELFDSSYYNEETIGHPAFMVAA